VDVVTKLVDEDVELVDVTLEVFSIVAPELVEVKVVDESVAEVDVDMPDVVLTTSVTKLDEEGGSCRARRRTSRLVW